VHPSSEPALPFPAEGRFRSSREISTSPSLNLLLRKSDVGHNPVRSPKFQSLLLLSRIGQHALHKGGSILPVWPEALLSQRRCLLQPRRRTQSPPRKAIQQAYTPSAGLPLAGRLTHLSWHDLLTLSRRFILP